LVMGNSGNNTITLDLPSSGAIIAAFSGGGGADTFIFSNRPTDGGEAYFADISSNDRIDATALNITDIVSGTVINLTDNVPEPDGWYLISSDVMLIVGDGEGGTTTIGVLEALETDGDWLLVSAADGQFQVVTDLYGSMTEDTFLI